METIVMKKGFSWRVFISFGLTISFFVLLVSGVVLYIAPPGRVANWIDWRMLGLSKGGWKDQHIMFGFTFIVLSVFHLFVINWKAFFSYLKTAAGTGLKHSRELFGSLLLFLVFATGTFFALQPFSGIIDFGTSLSQSWERKEGRPPVPHAETMSLTELSKQPGLGGDPELLKTKLETAGYRIDSVEQTLADIASRNRTTAENLYRHIASREKSESGPRRQRAR